MLELRGRDDELQVLIKAWNEAKDGKAGYVRIMGEPGTGKTRLVQEFYRYLIENEDTEHYWPEALQVGDEKSPIIPEFTEIPDSKNLRFLWLGHSCAAGTEINTTCFAPYRQAAGQICLHVFSWIRNRKLTEEQKQLYVKVFVKLMDLVPMLKLFVIGHDIASKLKKSNEESKKLLKFGSTRMSDRLASASESGKEELLLSCLRDLSDSSDETSPTIPIVLVLDDAQWADGASLGFTNELLSSAVENNWKLLLITTIRGNEVLEQQSSTSTGGPSYALTAEVIESGLRRKRSLDRYFPINLDNQISDEAARQIFRDHLPRASEDSVSTLLKKSGRQPFFIVNFAKMILESKLLDDMGRLKMTEDELRTFPTEIKDLIEERLKRIQRHNAKSHRVMLWGSVNGINFLREFIKQVAERFGEFTSASALTALSQLRDVHELVTTFPPPPKDLRRYHFNNPFFYELALQQLSEEERELAEDCLYGTLKSLLESGRLATLPNDEQVDYLLRLAALSRDRGDDTTEFRSLLAANEHLLMLFQFTDARPVAKGAVDLLEKDNTLIELVPSQQLGDLVTVLLELHLTDEAVYASDLMISHAFKSLEGLDLEQALRDMVFACESGGDVKLAAGSDDEAFSLFVDAYEYRLKLLTHDPSLETKRGLIIPLVRIGDIMRRTDSSGEVSIERYKEALKVINEITGPDTGHIFNRDLLRDKYILNERLGGVSLSTGRINDALAYYKEAQKISERIIKDYGSDYGSLRSKSIVLSRLADAHIKRNDPNENDLETALAYREEAYGIRKLLVQEYGRLPVALRDLHFEITRIGSLHLQKDEYAEALDKFNEALKICRDLYNHVSQPTPKDQADLAKVLSFIAWTKLLLKRYGDSISIGEESLKYKRTADTYFNISHAKFLSGADDALEHYRLGLAEFNTGVTVIKEDLEDLAKKGHTTSDEVERLLAGLEAQAGG